MIIMTDINPNSVHLDKGQADVAVLRAGGIITRGELIIRMAGDRLELRRPGQLSRYTLDELEAALAAARSEDDNTSAA